MWGRDAFEVFLNSQPERVSHYFEFEVAANNQWIDLEIDKTEEPFNDASWNSGFEHATRIEARRHLWTAEMRIPLAAMNVREVLATARQRVLLSRSSPQAVYASRQSKGAAGPRYEVHARPRNSKRRR